MTVEADANAAAADGNVEPLARTAGASRGGDGDTSVTGVGSFDFE